MISKFTTILVVFALVANAMTSSTAEPTLTSQVATQAQIDSVDEQQLNHGKIRNQRLSLEVCLAEYNVRHSRSCRGFNTNSIKMVKKGRFGKRCQTRMTKFSKNLRSTEAKITSNEQNQIAMERDEVKRINFALPVLCRKFIIVRGISKRVEQIQNSKTQVDPEQDSNVTQLTDVVLGLNPDLRQQMDLVVRDSRNVLKQNGAPSNEDVQRIKAEESELESMAEKDSVQADISPISSTVIRMDVRERVQLALKNLREENTSA